MVRSNYVMAREKPNRSVELWKGRQRPSGSALMVRPRRWRGKLKAGVPRGDARLWCGCAFGVGGLRGDLDRLIAPGALAVEGDGGDAEVVALPAVEPLDDD